jgi:hypothetical protein
MIGAGRHARFGSASLRPTGDGRRRSRSEQCTARRADLGVDHDRRIAADLRYLPRRFAGGGSTDGKPDDPAKIREVIATLQGHASAGSASASMRSRSASQTPGSGRTWPAPVAPRSALDRLRRHRHLPGRALPRCPGRRPDRPGRRDEADPRCGARNQGMPIAGLGASVPIRVAENGWATSATRTAARQQQALSTPRTSSTSSGS